MRRAAIILGLSLILTSSAAWGQGQTSNSTGVTTTAPGPRMFSATTQGDVYCSGIITTKSVPTSTQIVSGEEADSKLTFSTGNYVYINKGANKGVKPGDEFSVIRKVDDYTRYTIFTMQDALLHQLGTQWADIGRVKVLIAGKNVSTAQVENSCEFMQRGDVVVPFEERPVPPFKSERDFDRFAPPSGKATAMVVTGKAFQMESGNYDIVYVNLGSDKGIKVGDYFRIFRYHGNLHQNLFQLPDPATNGYGYGSAPAGTNWTNLPREVLGEGIVLRTSPKAATVLITYSLREIFGGDYAEVE